MSESYGGEHPGLEQGPTTKTITEAQLAAARKHLMTRINAVLDDRWPLAGKILAAVDEYVAALPDTGLDVERLALAVHNEQLDWTVCGVESEAYDDHMAWHRRRAERLRAEYARLTREEGA